MVVLSLFLMFIVFAIALIVLIAVVFFASALNFLMPVFTVASGAFFLSALITLIVLTKKGKFSKTSIEEYKTQKYGKVKAVSMKLFQVVLWLISVFTLISTVACIAYIVINPFKGFAFSMN